MENLSSLMPKRGVKNIFFIGIAGVGMSGIAEVLLSLGYQVFGSDRVENAASRRLIDLGATIYQEHVAEQVDSMDVVVVSSAIHADNVELMQAHEKRIPVIPRAEMLAEVMRFRKGIAIAGTHGKTTTTSLVAAVLGEAGLDPTFVVGGKVNSTGSHSRLGASALMIAEADESDASFLHLQPLVAVVTNIDADHLSAYENDFSKLRAAFIEFLHNLPFYGLAVLCIDDPEVRSILPDLGRPFISYGFSEDADVRAHNLVHDQGEVSFSVTLSGIAEALQFRLNLPGEHNVQNALAAIAIALECNVDSASIGQALSSFAGIGRRMQCLGQVPYMNSDICFYDDYAHHPRELVASLKATRAAWPAKRLIAVFQPHRYSRTRDLFDDFVDALSSVDVLLLMPVYSAGEEPLKGADSTALALALRNKGLLEPIVLAEQQSLFAVLEQLVAADDLVLTMGAGSIGRLAHDAFEQFNQQVSRHVG